MPNDPSALSYLLANFKLGYQELQYAGLIRICEVEVVENIVCVPEVGVDGDDSEPLSSCMSICAIVGGGVFGF